MRFSLQSSLAMPTTRLIFLFFLLILPNNSSTYQRRRKPVCPKAFHLIGINCADKKTTKYHRSCSGGKCYYYAGFKLNWFRAIQVKLFIWNPTILHLIPNVHIFHLQFCHSFGRGVSLACLENNQENSAVADWLQQHGEDNDYCHYIAESWVYCHFWGISLDDFFDE